MSKASISVEGFIANDLQVREAGTSHRVVSVSVPHTPQKQVDGRWEDAGPTTWFEAVFWDDHGTELLTKAEKGSLVIVTGIPELEVYLKRDGTPGGKVKITYPTLAVVVRKPRKGTQQATAAPYSAEQADVWESPAFGDETPF